MVACSALKEGEKKGKEKKINAKHKTLIRSNLARLHLPVGPRHLRSARSAISTLSFSPMARFYPTQHFSGRERRLGSGNETDG